ncbi:unnamed protein product [Somion occarium]|uniref:Transposase n=1 Tax=Somion occarium TaxID=3059160 RepID=A0ABP1CSG2_9APHY
MQGGESPSSAGVSLSSSPVDLIATSVSSALYDAATSLEAQQGNGARAPLAEAPTSVTTDGDPGSLADISNQTSAAPACTNDSEACAVADAPNYEAFEDTGASLDLKIWELKIAQDFINELHTASLDDSKLSQAAIKRLRNTPRTATPETMDPLLRLSIEIYLATENASQKMYNEIRDAFHRCYPNDKLLSYDEVKNCLAELTGIYPLLEDMCPNSCIAFTGPFKKLDKCPLCGAARYDEHKLAASGGKEKVGRSFYTIPIGPQVQALLRSPQTAEHMHYRKELIAQITETMKNAHPPGFMEAYEDIFHGSDFLAVHEWGDIGPDDILLMLSIDGAQLYQNKQSDCWIYIWVVLNLSPDLRYKKKYVLPGSFIPGPNKPKNLDSFLFPGLHHVAALQKEGLSLWDAYDNRTFLAALYVALATANSPGMASINGLVGHHGGHGCRVGCPM